MMASIFAAMIGIFMYIKSQSKDKSAVPIMSVDGGFDDEGDGKAGGGGVENPIAIGNFAPNQKDYENLPQVDPIAEVKEEIKKQIAIDDPNGSIPIPDEKAAPLAALDKALRDRMVGNQKGTGNGPGKGDGPAGDGDGGTGASSTRARSLRWIMRFRTTDGRDYLNQLSAMGATVLVPLPPENKSAYVFRDLSNPKPGELVTEKEWKKLDTQIRFADFKRDSVQGVASALGLDFTPSSFWAFFPKGLEEELSRKEIAYGNRRPEDIEETVFEVVVRGGKATISVAVQRIKR